MKRIKGIQEAQERNFNPFLEDLGRKLAREMEDVLNQEEALWFQKARCYWIKDGNRNTRYYYTKATIPRRRNKIHMLKNDDGVWSEDPKVIKETIVTFFKKLFEEDKQERNVLEASCNWPRLDSNDWDKINLPFTVEEITAASQEVGKYLGAHLIHGRHSKQKFKSAATQAP
ncbi:ribonuclease H [Senna tora]|uniref:Ribonuclease H n=1 Tax=Senna tora TaxID=362788 RepID=A0A834TPF3_9FABA|nr:ribonuclease H [Senna tora]